MSEALTVASPPASGIRLNILDRLILFVAPKWGAARVRARLLARHFEAASVGRRTSGWSRRNTDANSAAGGATLARLRDQARDLVRNNAWARRGLNRLATNTVGWGIRPKGDARAMAAWKAWAETTQCDSAGLLTFYGLQSLAMRTIVESGEVLVRRRWRRPGDGLAVPLQLQVLEPDYLDTGKDNLPGTEGGKIRQGIEYDAIGRRVAYWLFTEHPGSLQFTAPLSVRVPASEVLHVFDVWRPGQARGSSWFASVDVRLHDFDEYEDATLMKQKIAACMAAFVTDLDGQGPSLGKPGESKGQQIDTFEPGMILNLPAGKQVTVANPPVANDYQAFAATQLRAVAAGLGVTYEDLTGDYSQVNYSSARMARIAHVASVYDWQWNMLIPQLCAPVWIWMLEAMRAAGGAVDVVAAEWTPPALAMIDPDKEGLANMRAVRAGQKTPDEMVREQGWDPEEHWQEYADGIERLKKLGIVIDSDASQMSSSGQLHPAPAPHPDPDPEIERLKKEVAEERALRAGTEADRDAARERARLAEEGARYAALAREQDKRIASDDIHRLQLDHEKQMSADRAAAAANEATITAERDEARRSAERALELAERERAERTDAERELARATIQSLTREREHADELAEANQELADERLARATEVGDFNVRIAKLEAARPQALNPPSA